MISLSTMTLDKLKSKRKTLNFQHDDGFVLGLLWRGVPLDEVMQEHRGVPLLLFASFAFSAKAVSEDITKLGTMLRTDYRLSIVNSISACTAWAEFEDGALPFIDLAE